MVEVRKTTIRDIYYLYKHMRSSDIDECLQLVGRNPYSVLLESLKTAKESIVGVEDGIVFCIVGVADDNQVWMLFTKEFNQFKPSIIKKAVPIARKWVKTYGFLHGYTQQCNGFVLKFVVLLGFTVEDTVETLGGMPVKKFWKEG